MLKCIVKEDGTQEYIDVAEEEEVFDVPVSVEQLKQQLDASDYKVIKCYEYSLAGLPLPYDIHALHTERQAIRDKINELEAGQ